MTPEPHRPVLGLLTSYWLSLLGAALVTNAGVSWLLVLPLHVRGHVDNPYIGLLVFIFIPIVFFLGLALIPVGLLLAKGRISAGLVTAPDRQTTLRRIAMFVIVTTIVNVMKPEFTAHQNVSHEVAGIGCHAEPGATGWVKSKMAGTGS